MPGDSRPQPVLRLRSGICLSHHGVGTSDGQFIDRVCVDHITVIDDAVYPVLPDILRCDQHVVVVAVVVNHALPYLVQLWLGVRPIVGQKALDHGLIFLSANPIDQALDDRGCLFEIPVKRPVGRWMVKTAQRRIQMAEKFTQALQKPRVMGITFANGFPGRIRQHSYKMTVTGRSWRQFRS